MLQWLIYVDAEVFDGFWSQFENVLSCYLGKNFSQTVHFDFGTSINIDSLLNSEHFESSL
jgi:hypothetical protein